MILWDFLEKAKNGLDLDLEFSSDLRKLQDPELYLLSQSHRLVILDEAQRLPELSSLLRSLIDENRKPGRFLLLGSASPDLRKQGIRSVT